jgi:hypothetical protein
MLLANLGRSLLLAMRGICPEVPAAFDQRFFVLETWGFLASWPQWFLCRSANSACIFRNAPAVQHQADVPLACVIGGGCRLRARSEILAYQGCAGWAWSWLPVSAVMEMTAVTVFAANLIGTFLSRPPSQELKWSVRESAIRL